MIFNASAGPFGVVRGARAAQMSSCRGPGSVEFKVLRIFKGFQPFEDWMP